MPMLRASLFTIAKIRKQPKCPSRLERIKKIWNKSKKDKHCMISHMWNLKKNNKLVNIRKKKQTQIWRTSGYHQRGEGREEGQCGVDVHKTSYKEVSLQLSKLRIQHCHCSGLGHCCSEGSIPGWGTFTCRGCCQIIISYNIVQHKEYSQYFIITINEE